PRPAPGPVRPRARDERPSTARRDRRACPRAWSGRAGAWALLVQGAGGWGWPVASLSPHISLRLATAGRRLRPPLINTWISATIQCVQIARGIFRKTQRNRNKTYGL